MAGPAELAHDRARLIDRLSARFGSRNIAVNLLAATHIPEHAACLGPLAQRRPEPMRSANALPDRGAARPLRLFDPPEPVEVMAEVPDGPPLKLRWRRRALRIVAVHGPERIAPEWWTPTALTEPTKPDRTRD